MRACISPGRGETALDVSATLADVSEDRGWQLALGLIAAWRAAGDVRRASAVTRRLSEAAKGDGSMVEQAVLGLTALGNMFIELCADCTGSPSTPSSGTPRPWCTTPRPANRSGDVGGLPTWRTWPPWW